ncbi:MAG: metallophosphoesterase family protein [Spirochaetales bacterium]|nr:metallophosphoesterase family protein [Spirochaetales bacterium]
MKYNKIAAIYDLHANYAAIEAVLKEIEHIGVDLLLIGGDVISGPLPNESLDLLKRSGLPSEYILGNAESDVLNNLSGQKINGLSARADEEAIWLTNVLSKENIECISNWQQRVSVESCNMGQILFCHGSPRSNQEVFTPSTTNTRLTEIFKNTAESIVVCGHTHMQFELKLDNLQIVNAGSVGMPFGEMDACWLLIDEKFNFMHTKYDVNKASYLVKNSDYPYAESFIENNIVTTPEILDMLKIFDQIEKTQTGKFTAC